MNSLTVGENSFLGYPVSETFDFKKVIEGLRPYYDRYNKEAEAYNLANHNGSFRMAVGIAGMWYRFGKSGSLMVETQAELACDGHIIVCSAP
jgi:hypothetical protein